MEINFTNEQQASLSAQAAEAGTTEAQFVQDSLACVLGVGFPAS